MRPWRNRQLLQMEMEKTGTESAGHHSLAVAKASHQPPPRTSTTHTKYD